jgi:hypothetical protein
MSRLIRVYIRYFELLQIQLLNTLNEVQNINFVIEAL